MGKSLDIKVNTASLRAGLEKVLTEEPKVVEKAMFECSVLMQKGAVDRSPKLRGILANSIHSEVFQGADGTTAQVYIPSNSPAQKYAQIRHDGEYKLGKLSLAKQAKVNVKVGPGFIFRALSEQEERLKKCIEFNLSRGLGRVVPNFNRPKGM